MNDDLERVRFFYPTTEVREYRTRRAVTLARVAIQSGIPAARVSLVERFPERARPGELARLRAAVDRAAAELLDESRSAKP